jgi:hypothetical protein
MGNRRPVRSEEMRHAEEGCGRGHKQTACGVIYSGGEDCGLRHVHGRRYVFHVEHVRRQQAADAACAYSVPRGT